MYAGYLAVKAAVEDVLKEDPDWPVTALVVEANRRGVAITAEFQDFRAFGGGSANIEARVVVVDARGGVDSQNYRDAESIAEKLRRGLPFSSASPSLLEMSGGSESIQADRETGFAIELTFDGVIDT